MSPEDLATKILNDNSIQKAPIPVEEISAKYNLSIVSYDFGPSVSGALLIQEGNSVIGINPYDPPLRKRFTVAHELGHFLMHKKENTSIFIDKKNLLGLQIHFRNEESSTGDRKKEREANAFAAALLMPSFILKKELTQIINTNPDFTDEDIIKELSNKFEVSTIAMSYRLANLGYIE